MFMYALEVFSRQLNTLNCNILRSMIWNAFVAEKLLENRLFDNFLPAGLARADGNIIIGSAKFGAAI